MTPTFDIHCHIEDIDTHTITRARAAEIMGAVCNSATPDDWDKIIQLTDQDDFYHGAVGVHPWCASDVDENWQSKLTNILLSHPNLMIGETGLDKHYPDINNQINILTRQIKIAHEMGRGIQIHCVGTWDKLLNILAHTALPPIIIIHSYNAGPDITLDLLRYNNIYFSYSPRIIRTATQRTIDAMNQIPANRMLVESDSSNPADARNALNWITKNRNDHTKDLAQTIYQNSQTVIKQ